MHHDCDEFKIRENRKCAPRCSGKHFFEGGMFDLRFQCDFMKNDENRKCAPRCSGRHLFANFVIVSRGPENQKCASPYNYCNIRIQKRGGGRRPPPLFWKRDHILQKHCEIIVRGNTFCILLTILSLPRINSGQFREGPPKWLIFVVFFSLTILYQFSGDPPESIKIVIFHESGVL